MWLYLFFQINYSETPRHKSYSCLRFSWLVRRFAGILLKEYECVSQRSEATHGSHMYSLWNCLLASYLPFFLSLSNQEKNSVLKCMFVTSRWKQNKVLVHKLCHCKAMVSYFENPNLKGLRCQWYTGVQNTDI